MKIRSLIYPALCAAGVFVLYITISLAHGPKRITQRGDFSREILEGDHSFLDHLFERMNDDDRKGLESSLVPTQKIDNAGKLESSPKTVRRAMLVANTEIVRRGQLVVHGEVVKRKRQNITSSRHRAEVL